MDRNELDRRLKFAVGMAEAAGELAMSFFVSGDFKVEGKGDGSPVTEADCQVEVLLRERIAETYPADGILGEEEGESEGTSGCRWILDPIDGTRSFIQGVPLFGTLIGLEVDGECVLGVAHLPGIGETVAGARGRGTHWWRGGGEPTTASVSETKRLQNALVLTTSVKGWDAIDRGASYRSLLDNAAEDRGWSDCYGLLLIATGRADVLAEPVLHPWDCAAFLPILEEAGGLFTDLRGQRTIYGGSGLATNGVLHEAALARLLT